MEQIALPLALAPTLPSCSMSAASNGGEPPDGVCIYAVSDIHGCAEQLAKVFAAFDQRRLLVAARMTEGTSP
jgi:hypothetical protein